jgi:uncharacterized membrane protein
MLDKIAQRQSRLSSPSISVAPPSAASRRRSIVLGFACTILGTLAQFLMKNGVDHSSGNLLALLTNVPLLAGYTLYGINTVMLVIALREGELSLVYPILALTYVWVTLLSYLALHEAPNVFKNLGVAAIIAGVIVISRGSRK